MHYLLASQRCPSFPPQKLSSTASTVRLTRSGKNTKATSDNGVNSSMAKVKRELQPEAVAARAVNAFNGPSPARGRNLGHDAPQGPRLPSRPAGPHTAISSSAMSPPTRGRRSGAPTVDTHAVQEVIDLTEPENDDDDDDDEPQLREVRLKAVKPEPETMNGVHGHPFPGSEGDIDKNLKDIGQHLKKFNDTLGSLQQLGIHHDTPLPELILVGDQSSGKSSLMSAISQIILPRKDGVCTRCPIHIRLSSDTAWRCRITLQQDYAYRPVNNEPITEADVTEQNPFPPWVKQQREVKEFKMIFDKTEPIDEIVRWAQIAILNHNSNYENYIPNDQRPPADLNKAEEKTEAKFSPNTVAVEVKGPNLPDLSFYDMPGVFRNAKHEEDQFLVKVVENLVRSYVSHEKAIILWAVPMNHDPETSSTFTLIRNLRAQDRTIGVMTKADLLPQGGHAQWLAMLRDQTHQVGRGYYITSRAALSSSNEDADHDNQRRDRASLRDESATEEQFFNGMRGDWPKEFAEFDEKCGVNQLVKFLAQTLAQEFARNLPDLTNKLRTKFLSTQAELRKLPEMPQNPEYEVRRSLFKFTSDFQARLTSKAFSSSWGKIAETFKIRIIDLKPRYRLLPDGFRMAPKDGASASDRESIFSSAANNSPSLSIKRQLPIDLTTEGPSGRRRRAENGHVKVEDSGRFNDTPVPFPGLGPPSSSGRVPSKTLSQIRNMICSEREAGRPGEVPYEVKETLSLEAIKPWSGPLHIFINDTMKHLRQELTMSLNESFKELKKRQVYTNAKKLTLEWLSSHKTRITQQLERNYKMEISKVYTMDDDTFHRHRVHEAHLLKRHRHFLRWKAHNGDTTYEAIEEWDKLSADARRKEEQKMAKDGALLGEDPFELELGVASHVRGYYLTAAMRFIDIVAMHIISGLFRDLEADIEHYLDERMGLNQSGLGADFFTALMEEEQSTAEKRIRLRAELERFDKAVKEIADLNATVIKASANGGSAPPTQQEDTSMEDATDEVDMDEG
ncbi:unnamed protein product [Discula destructiva]